jgi:RNA polymerase sigma-70 factor (ECF subfamily)
LQSAGSVFEPALGNVRGLLRDLTQEPDETLFARYRATGSRDCFAELVRRYERELYSYLRRYLGSAQHAEDAFQAVFLQVHLKCHQFQPERPFRPWLYAIATNQAIDAKRRQRRRATVSFEQLAAPSDYSSLPEGGPRGMSSREPDPALEAGDAERKELLDRALGQLSEPMRTAIQLVFYQGLKYREAADILRVPVGTVKSRVHAAVQRLNEFWQRRRDDVD